MFEGQNALAQVLCFEQVDLVSCDRCMVKTGMIRLQVTLSPKASDQIALLRYAHSIHS